MQDEKYYVFHCAVSEVNVTENAVVDILEAHSLDNKAHRDKNDALCELRDLLDRECDLSLHKEIERLNRVVAVLDRRLIDALTDTV